MKANKMKKCTKYTYEQRELPLQSFYGIKQDYTTFCQLKVTKSKSSKILPLQNLHDVKQDTTLTNFDLRDAACMNGGRQESETEKYYHYKTYMVSKKTAQLTNSDSHGM